jgi:hypothetical protein
MAGPDVAGAPAPQPVTRAAVATAIHSPIRTRTIDLHLSPVTATIIAGLRPGISGRGWIAPPQVSLASPM